MKYAVSVSGRFTYYIEAEADNKEDAYDKASAEMYAKLPAGFDYDTDDWAVDDA